LLQSCFNRSSLGFHMAANKKGESPKFLAGWKEISNYLGKGVRTVQRYEREMGLPIRRPAGKSRAAVVATKAELDAWVSASPFREAFYLPRVAANNEAVTANIRSGMKEMRRLRNQMFDLREEVIRTVAILRESVETVHKGVRDSWRNRSTLSAPDFDRRGSSILTLVGTQVNRKAN
jgi:hypothetical protein